MRANTLLFSLLFLTLCSCSVYQPIKLQPETTYQEIYWLNGTPQVTKEKDGIQVKTSYDGDFARELRFTVCITNNSSADLEIDPLTFKLTALDSLNGAGISVAILDPEASINDVQSRISTLERKQANSDMWGALVAAGQLVNGVSAVVSDKNKEKKAEMANSLNSVQANKAYNDESRYQEMNKLQNELQFYDQLLRRNTLYPGESVTGVIRFVRNRGKIFVLSFPFDGDRLIRIRFDEKENPQAKARGSW